MTGSGDLALGASMPVVVQPSLGAVRRTVREVGLALIVGGIIVLLFVVYQLFGTTLSEQRAQASLGRSFARAELHGGAPAAAPAPASAAADRPTVSGAPRRPADLSPSTPAGSAIEHLEIPRIGLDRYVVQGTAEQDLMRGPGHYVDTPFPGQRGNAAIAGHRTTYGAPFFRLDELSVGDRIYVTNTKSRTFVYAVERKFIAQPTGPSATAVLADTRTSELTLTTCNPRFEATNRLVVVAALVGRPVSPALASPTLPVPRSAPVVRSRPSDPPAAARNLGNLGSGDGGAWPPAAAYGGAVVALWTLTRLAVNRTRRWRRAGSLVAGITVCAVPLWYCFESVVRLLPQSI